ncbi:Tyrosine recombinase XerD [Serratia quinivorans]|nr:Tyrosine recombinase XerD [Serratia quinivorans]
MLREYGRRAGLEVEAHPHMLRHACGYALADNGADTRVIQDYLGHRNIQHTVLYTAANAGRFRDLWEEKRQKNVTL